MPSAPLPVDEPQRLAALRALGILDTPPDVEFDALVRAVAVALGGPIALLTLIDEDRQWFKASVGLPDAAQTPRDLAFCAYTILVDDLLEVPDATRDPRFAQNRLVTGPPEIRSYLGVPLRLSDGSRVGALSVLAHRPRNFREPERRLLRDFGIIAASALENWRIRRLQRQIALDLQASEARLRTRYEATPAMLHVIDDAARLVAVSDLWLAKLGYSRAEVLGREVTAFLTPASRAFAESTGLPALGAAGPVDGLPLEMVRKDGAVIDVLLSAVLERAESGTPLRALAVVADVTERRHAERALAEERQHLAYVLAASDCGAWEWNLQTGELHVDARWSQIAGRTPAELSAASMRTRLDLIHPEDRQRAADALRAHLDGIDAHYKIEFRTRRWDGDYVWVMSCGKVMTWSDDGKPERMFGTIKDISERRRQEEALRIVNERMMIATDSGGIGIWDWDLEHNRTVWDAWMFRLHGIAPTDAIQDRAFWHGLLHPDDLAPAQQAVRDALAGPAPLDGEYRVMWPDGGVRHLRVSARVTRNAAGRAVRMVGANWDVTEQRRLAAELASEAARRAAAEAAEREFALFKDSIDFYYVFAVTETHGDPLFVFESVSPASRNVIGLAPEEMVGRRAEACFSGEEAANGLARLRAVLATGKKLTYARSRQTPNGRRDFEGTITPIRHAATGRITRIAGTMRDVTERNRIQEELLHSQKMTAIGRLASGVSHDFNNILQSISGSLELALDTAAPGTREHEFLSVGLRAANRGSYLTSHLLSYARKQLLRPSDIDLRSMFSDFVILLGRTLGPHVVVQTKCDHGAARVRVDAGQLQTALLNLAINAAHAMPDGGTITIATHLECAGGTDRVVIAVADTGTGMDTATLAQAFEPFFTTKGLDGSGLGLSMVQGFVEQSGGEIRIRSELGVGTTVALLLPSAGPADGQVAGPRRDPARESGTVLLVDDDADVLVTTAAFLENAGFNVARAANANQALALLAASTPFRAIVTDYAMPGMNGLELVTEAREHRPGLPAIVISGYMDLKETDSLGPNTIQLRKPFPRDVLISAVVQAWRADGQRGRAIGGRHSLFIPD